MLVHEEGLSLGRSYSVPVAVHSVHQAVVSRGSVGILPWILGNAPDNKKVEQIKTVSGSLISLPREVLLTTKAALTAKLFMKECWIRQLGCSWPTHGVPSS